MAATQEMDMAKAEAFGGRVIDIINGGQLTLMMTVGHKTGLFDTMAELPPSTSAQIAQASNLNERYVREWLGAMVTGRFIEYDAGNRRYVLPPEHAAMLTRAAGPGNMCTFAQFAPLFGQVTDQVVDSFKNGGGVPYAEYGEFQTLMSDLSSQIHDGALIDVTLPLVPGIVEKLKSGVEVADVGCGRGHSVNLMAKAFPNSRFVGYDFSEEGVAAGAAEAAQMNLPNARFEMKDVATLDGGTQFQFITAFDSIHDQAQPRQVLKGIHDALRSDGTFLCVDIAASSSLEENMDHPLGPTLYSSSTMHCMTVSLALGGEGLGTVWGEQTARELFAEAGFSNVDTKQVEGDIFNAYYVMTK